MIYDDDDDEYDEDYDEGAGYEKPEERFRPMKRKNDEEDDGYIASIMS